MPIEHIRDIAKFGVITDPDPYDLPDTAWSFAANVRFRNGVISSGPVFRNVFQLGTVSPRFSVATIPNQGTNQLFTGYLNGEIFQYANGAETNATLAGYTPTNAEAAWSSVMLADILYVNRSDRAPWFLTEASTVFQNLGVVSGGVDPWPSTYTCQLIRALGGALVALNVTKAGTNFPTMVKTSSIPLSDQTPASWNIEVADTLATENILSEMQGQIVDACRLGPQLIIYGQQEAWIMTADGSIEVYDTIKLPFQKGAINTNCSFELDGKNYVFGVDDLWVHDGNTEVSIVDEQNRDFIFGSINMALRNRCFIAHNPQLKELYFCYVSGDQFINFNAPDGCNRSYVYNYVTKTGTFDDIPLVYAASNANLNMVQTYANTTATYANAGGTYQSQEDTFSSTPVFVGDVNSQFGLFTSLYAFDLVGTGSTVSSPVDTNATQPRFLQRVGIDLDSLNEDLRGYKVMDTLYPQGRLGPGAQPIQFAVGATDFSNVTPVFSPYQIFDGAANYKLDFNVAGRYLAIQILYDDFNPMSLTGFDVDIKVTGQF